MQCATSCHSINRISTKHPCGVTNTLCISTNGMLGQCVPHSCQLESMLHSCHDPEVRHPSASNQMCEDHSPRECCLYENHSSQTNSENNQKTEEQWYKILMFSVVLAYTSSSTISLVASNDIFTSGVFCQMESSQFQPESGFHFLYLEKSVEQTAELLQTYNESCVFGGDTK